MTVCYYLYVSKMRIVCNVGKLNEEVIRLRNNHTQLVNDAVTISSMEQWEHSFEGEKKTSKRKTAI